ncbi:MAG: hypothetical protein HON53_03800 [Planctomycetaceae bacterium]|jgi:hypothetical protein|nr:hypothetical protein [Planctomycetaceae bacterium]MBT6154139.1 hypothetical protein [Planctomycetaceae bacterium]MBT6487864.1 hypothetical protein [Planctomycetaceae bacterium]MBT6495674.1 hypothetical protein [Planctomycetaceae bacterium]
MRVQLWLAPILGLLLTVSSRQELKAQYAPPQAGGHTMLPGMRSNVRHADARRPRKGRPARGTLLSAFQKEEPAPAGGGFIPNGYSSPYGGAPGQSPYAAGMLPSPQISPFEHRFDQTYNSGGMWTRFTSNQNREYFSTFEYLDTKTRHAKGFVGDKNAATYKEIYLPFLATEETRDGLDDTAILADLFQGDADFIDGVGEFPAVGDPGQNLFNARSNNYSADVGGRGFRIVTGFNEAGGDGMVLDFWINGESSSDFNAARALTARGNVGNPASAGVAGRGVSEQGTFREVLTSPDGILVDIGQTDTLQVLSRNLLNLSSIPVDDGTLRVLADGTYLGGTSIPYDVSFRLKNRTESLGTSLNFISTRKVRSKYIKANFVFGGRYVYINESFRFDGEDSGLGYETITDTDEPFFSRAKVHSLPNFVDDNSDNIIDEAIFVEDDLGGGQGGGGAATTEGRAVRLDLVAAIAGTEHPGNYQAFLESKMTTHLTGPEVGLNYNLGGDTFRIRGLTKVGLMANFEKIKLSGNNIGDANNIGDTIDLEELADPLLAGVVDSPLVTPTAANPTPNDFASTYHTTHVSPLLEQKVSAEFPLFRYIPMMKRKAILQNATFTAGWSVIWIGEVARPTQSIVWKANPRAGLFPSIKIDRADWWTMNWSFGLTIPF